MPPPAISQRLLVAQSVVADPIQLGLASFDGMCGVVAPNPGVAAINLEKLGLISAAHFVNWGAGVIQGEVVIEVADEVSNTGAWQQVAVVTFSGAAPKMDYQPFNGPFGAVRHRITQPVVGGSVTTKIVGT